MASMFQGSQILTVPEVAARLGLSRWSVYREVESGEIPSVKLGTGRMAPVRVDEGELDRWLFSESA